MWLNGALTGPLTAKLDLFASQMTELKQRIDLLPRSDQLIAVDAHAHALDGRMDAMETRMRADEIDIATGKQRLQSIEDSSHAAIGGRR